MIYMIGTARKIEKTLAIALLVSQQKIPSRNICTTTNNMLASGNCIPCSELNPNNLIPIDQLKQRITETIPLWTLHEGHNVQEVDKTNKGISDGRNYYSINRKFTAKNFQSALNCINDVGRIAEEQNHHPDLHISNYRDVHIELYTHKVRGVTENDIQLAHMIDKNVSIEYSPKWLKDHPEALLTSKTM